MKNIVSFSLWGDLPMYWIGAIKNIELVNKYLPGWICRFYIDKNCKKELIETIHGDNVEVILMESMDSFHGMFWRFLASEDLDVNIFLSRDCDSRISKREINAIEEWLKSDKDFHIMRDHPYHSVPILGGMWGCRNGIMREIGLSNMINDWSQYQRKGIDQDFLGQKVYPIVKDRTIEHSEFGIRFDNIINKFPSERENYEFVGDVFDENDNRHPEYLKILKNN